MYNNIMARPIVKDHPSAQNSENIQEWTLNANDRCDRCSAQAYVKVNGSTGDLLFCGHHYDKIMNDPNAYTKMMSFMLEVIDERERLIDNRSQGNDY